MPEEKKDGKEVRESNEESVIVNVNSLLEVMDSLSTKHIHPQAYQDMWEELYLRLSQALSDKQPKKEEEEENPVMDDDDDEGVEEDDIDIPSEQPTTPPPKPSRPKMKEDLLDDDLLA